MSQVKEIVTETSGYLHGAWNAVQPFWAVIISGVSYLIFPDKAFIPPAVALIVTFILDVLTKYYAVSKNNGGLFESVKRKKLTSNSLWEGTKKKLVGCVVIIILCGLSLRVASTVAFLGQVFTTFAYSVMFVREFQSICENMLEAGHEEFGIFLLKLKRKQKELLNKDLSYFEEEVKKEEKRKEKNTHE